MNSLCQGRITLQDLIQGSDRDRGQTGQGKQGKGLAFGHSFLQGAGPQRTMTGMKALMERARKMYQGGARHLILPGAVVLYGLWVLGSPSDMRTLTGFALLLGSRLLVVVHCWREAAATTDRYRIAWHVIGAALVLWTAADVLAGLWIIFMGEIPAAPSIWHWFRSAGSIAFLLGTAAFPLYPPERFSKLRTSFDVMALSFSTAVLFWSILILPILQIGLFPAIPFLWESLIVLFDMILILLLLRMFLLTESSRYPANVFMILAGAIILILAGDAAAGVMLLEADRSVGFPELCWSIGNLLLLLSLSPGVRVWRVRERRRLSVRTRRRLEFWLPIGMACLAAGYVLARWYLTAEPDWIGLGLTALLTVILVSRQGVIAGQYEMRQYEALVETAANPAFIIHLDGQFRLMNPAASGLAEAVNTGSQKPVLQELFLPEESFVDIVARAQEDGWEGLVRVPGVEKTYNLNLQPVRDDRLSVSLLAGSAYDLTALLERETALQRALDEVGQSRAELSRLNSELEQKVDQRTQELQKTVRQLAQLNEDLKELDRLKSEFVALVSHELRAPLTNIRTGVELAQRQMRSTATSPLETLAMVQKEIRRLEVFIETILDISALEAGKVHFQSAPLNLQEEFSSVVEEINPTGLADRVHVMFPDNLPEVLAEKRALHSVLYHLIDNTEKYAPEGAVRVSAIGDGEGVQVRICDEGPGIPAAERERVFDLFHRLDSSDDRAIYGYGLGLSVARRFLEAMSGWIRIEDPEESHRKGTCVVLWLPAARG